MHRECSHCRRSFTAKDLVREESKGLEAARKSLGLNGVRFLYYSCPDCSFADIFLDIHALPEESPDDFCHRRGELERAVRDFQGERIEAVICER